MEIETVTEDFSGVNEVGRQATSNRLMQWMRDNGVPALVMLASVSAVFVALLHPIRALTESLNPCCVPLLGSLAVCAGLLLAYGQRKEGSWDKGLALLLIVSFLSTLLLWALPDLLEGSLPEYTGYGENKIETYQAIVPTLLLLLSAVPLAASASYHLMGATPRAHDISRYGIVVLPIIVAFFIYGLLIWQVLSKGVSNWDWSVIVDDYRSFPAPGQPGLRNHILGTLLLMGLTSAISLPLGIGAGLYVGEYGGRLSGLVRFSINALRAISVFILGLAALSLVNSSVDSAFAGILQGAQHTGPGGTYLTASIFLSFLVIPVIARCTEQGCHSLPRELREASVSLGVSPGYTLTRLILPWSLPNVVTGLLIGCAEVAGCTAVIMFIAGAGIYGVGPADQVTTLDFVVFDAFFGKEGVHSGTMGPYQAIAAVLLLIITLGLSLVAVALKRRFGARFRSGS